MINYLYYKIFKSYSKENLPKIPHFYSASVLTGMFFLNIVSLNGFLAKLNLIPFLFANKFYSLTVTFAFLVGTLLYFNKSRRNFIFYKYSNENKNESKKGDVAIIRYIFLSIVAFIAGAFFRPGYLPRM